MAAKDIATQVEEIVLALLPESLELVDVEYVQERDWYLRVFIDKEGGIDLDDCQALSEALEKELDGLGLIAGRYILEVSSPGLDRVLKKDRDFRRERGKKVDVSLYAPLTAGGAKEIVGTLTDFDGESLTLDENLQIPKEKISLVRLHIDF
ncbi:MAG: ribosome maturation factor RimP [Selenomonadaceae bacterium]|nr:ribosome maturation factor RimP [Selenomonadaceae bacterium]